MSRLARLKEFRLKAETDVIYYEINGVKVAVDAVYKITVNGRGYGEVVAMPSNLEELVLGLAASEPSLGDPGRVSVKIVDGEIAVEAQEFPTVKLNREECGGLVSRYGHGAPQGMYSWTEVYAVYADFSRRTASSIYGVSAHSAAIYDLDSGSAVVAHDTSRHTAVLKVVGLAYRAGLLDSRARLAAVTTGRASADMVIRLANVGVGLIVTMRGPLASGLHAARLAGVTLVSNAKTGRGRALALLAGQLKGSD